MATSGDARAELSLASQQMAERIPKKADFARRPHRAAHSNCSQNFRTSAASATFTLLLLR